METENAVNPYITRVNFASYSQFDVRQFMDFDGALERLEKEVKKYYGTLGSQSKFASSQVHDLSHSLPFDIIIQIGFDIIGLNLKDCFKIGTDIKIWLLGHGQSLKTSIFQQIIQVFQATVHLLAIKRLTALFKRLTIALIQLQYIANIIHNRMSRSPSPHKKEPPIGGVKVGGDHFGSHVAEGSYSLSFSI